jgi:hypothetical protein
MSGRRSRFGSLCALVAAASLCASGGAAAQNSGATSPSEVPDEFTEVLGDDVESTPEGLYEVEVRGVDLVTHGPDLESWVESRESAGDVGFDPGDQERAPQCATDYYQHVLYARPSGAPDRYTEVKAELQAAIRRMNAVLNHDALESGGVSADYKVLCDGAGEIQVDSFVSAGPSFGQIVSAARAAGFRQPNADYTIFYDGTTGGCGVGSYIDDETLDASNLSNSGGGYAISYRDCWFNATPMHENGHAQGAVQYGAPNSTGNGGHCYDEEDVMCYSPDGGDLHQEGEVQRCTDRVHFDCGNDDYFDPSPEPGEYLESRWNLGSPLNRFIAFGPAPPPSPPTESAQTESEPPVEPISPEPPAEPASPGRSRVFSLVNHRRRSLTTAGVGEWRFLRIRVPRDRRALLVTLRSARAGDLDLYLRRGQHPTEGLSACRSAGHGPMERCLIRAPHPGRWYVGVHNSAGPEGAPFQIRAVHRREGRRHRRAT